MPYKFGFKERYCSYCGAVFKPKSPRNFYCSAECYRLSANKKYRERRFKKYGFNKNRIEKKCAICNEILPTAYQKFCLNCILDKIQNGNKAEVYYFKQILHNRGYDISMIRSELEWHRAMKNET